MLCNHPRASPRRAKLHHGHLSSMNAEQRPPPRRPCQSPFLQRQHQCSPRPMQAAVLCISFRDSIPCRPQPARVRPLGEQSLQEWSTETMRTGGLPGMLTLVPCINSCFAGRRWWLGSNRPSPSTKGAQRKVRSLRPRRPTWSLGESRRGLGRVDYRLALPPNTGARQALMGHLISTS